LYINPVLPSSPVLVTMLMVRSASLAFAAPVRKFKVIEIDLAAGLAYPLRTKRKHEF
jgi:hypothetical protein